MQLHYSAIHLLHQLDSLLVQLSDKQYTTPLDYLSKSTIGQHTRHTLEFFLCLMDAQNEGVINYDLRKRDQYIERETNFASGMVKSIIRFLQQEPADKPLVMEANYSAEKDELVGVQTTFYRELAYNIEHATHHMAIMKIGILTAFPEIELRMHFGVASSTIRHQKFVQPE